MRRNNGWISVHDEEKPESGEEVLTLWYSGGFPAPEDLFADPRDRAYGICVYYYPGDTAEQESDRWSPENPWREEYIVIEREGFYSLESNKNGAQKYRYLVTIAESPIGIVCWKHLDWPTPQN